MIVPLTIEKKQDSLGFGVFLSSERSFPLNVGFGQDALYPVMRRCAQIV